MLLRPLSFEFIALLALILIILKKQYISLTKSVSELLSITLTFLSDKSLKTLKSLFCSASLKSDEFYSVKSADGLKGI